MTDMQSIAGEAVVAALTSMPALFLVKLTGVLGLLLLVLLASGSVLRGSASRRHLLLVAGIVASLALPALYLAVPEWRLGVLPASVTVPATASPLVTAAVRQDVEPRAVARPSAELPLDKPGKTGAEFARAREGQAGPGRPREQTGWHWSADLWLGGAILVLLPWAVGIVRRTRLARSALSALPPQWALAVRRVDATIGVPRRVRFLATRRTGMPMTWGTIRPTVLLPFDVDWDATQRRDALLHELAHVRRLDSLVQLLTRAFCAVYWFHPLAWLVARAERAAREEACDDAVLRAGATPSRYAEQLLDVAKCAGPSRLPVAALGMARQSTLAGRLRAVLDERRPRTPVTRGQRILAAVLLGMTVVPLAAMKPVARTEPLESALPPVPVIAPEPHPAPAATGPREQPGRDGGLSHAAPAAVALALRGPAIQARQEQQQECRAGSGGSSHSSISENRSGDRASRTWKVRWKAGGCTLELDARGVLTLNDRADDIEGISQGGFLEIREDDGRTERSVRLEPVAGGGLTREYEFDGRPRSWDADGAAWLSRTLVRLDRRTAFAVETRLPVLLRQGGVDAVLAEVAQMDGYARRVYVTKLMDRETLTESQLRGIVVSAGIDLDSDYEAAELLIAVARQSNFGPDAQREAARIAGRMNSDYEQRRLLSALLDREALQPAVVEAMLASGRAIESDYELAELLIAVARRYAVNNHTRQYYLDALGTIESDYEHGRVLKAVVSSGAATTEQLAALAGAASSRMDGYELAESLLALTKAGGSSPSVARAVIRATASLNSDYERGRVVKAVVSASVDSSVAGAILEASRTIDSDHERTEILVALARRAPLNERLRALYVQAAEGMSSDYNRDRALAAIARAPAR
jgi:hypothetical protein